MTSNTAPTSGYDCKWIEDPSDELKCLICLSVARDPQQHGNGGCGKVFCQGCIVKYREITKTCPNCRKDLKTFKDERSTREVKALRVKCDNLENGCPWVNELHCLEQHLQVCEYTLVPCKYADVGCTKKLMRKDLEQHEKDDLHSNVAMRDLLPLNKKIKLVEDKLNVQEQQLIRTNAAQSNGKFTFKVTGYSQHDYRFYSQPFYSKPKGYKMCIRVWKCESKLHVLPHLMKGDNDDSLTWSFTGTVTFELLNQLEDKNHHTYTSPLPADSARVVEGEREMSGWRVKPIPHTTLDYNSDNNCQYLKDDTLIFRVSVQVPDYKPWLECTIQN